MKQPTTKEKQIEKIEGIVVEKPTYYEGVGRRKVSTARARLYVIADGSMTVRGQSVAKGDMVVNGKAVEKYFPGEIMKKLYLEPFRTTNTIGRFVVSVTANGGGLNGQLGSVVLAV